MLALIRRAAAGPVGSNWPDRVASTSSLAQSACSSGHFAGGTARTIRSCASVIQISVYDRPSYLSGACSRSTSAPSPPPISPTAELKAARAAVGDRR